MSRVFLSKFLIIFSIIGITYYITVLSLNKFTIVKTNDSVIAYDQTGNFYYLNECNGKKCLQKIDLVKVKFIGYKTYKSSAKKLDLRPLGEENKLDLLEDYQEPIYKYEEIR